MGKGINKKKVKQNTASKHLQSADINLPEKINAKEMQHIIACAIVEAEDIRQQREQARKEQEQQEWRKLIGCKDYAEESNKFIRFMKCLINDIFTFFRISFLSEKKITGTSTTNSLPKLFLTSCFKIVKWCLNFLTLLSLFLIPFHYFIWEKGPLEWYYNLLFCSFAFLSFVLSRYFRLISAEIENMEDSNYLFGLFAAVTSMISILLGIISIIKGA